MYLIIEKQTILLPILKLQFSCDLATSCRVPTLFPLYIDCLDKRFDSKLCLDKNTLRQNYPGYGDGDKVLRVQPRPTRTIVENFNNERTSIDLC